eukprot:1157902-Pelagomonas_calceolata.AAC.1
MKAAQGPQVASFKGQKRAGIFMAMRTYPGSGSVMMHVFLQRQGLETKCRYPGIVGQKFKNRALKKEKCYAVHGQPRAIRS